MKRELRRYQQNLRIRAARASSLLVDGEPHDLHVSGVKLGQFTRFYIHLRVDIP